MNTTTTDTTADTDMEAVLRRVSKLLAIAEDPRANAAEAAAAASMAEKVMRKYQIDNADIISASLKRGGAEVFGHSNLGSTLDPNGRSKEAAGWAGQLAVAVANLSDCQVRYVRTAEHGKTLRFQGYAADAQMAKFTYLYLVSQMISATGAFAKTQYNCAGRTELSSFRLGFVASVIVLIDRAIADKKAELAASVSGRSLVLVKANAVAEHFGAIKYKASRGGTGSYGGYNAGREAGSRCDVGRRGVGTNSSAGSIK